jgi:hypothetical protein
LDHDDLIVLVVSLFKVFERVLVVLVVAERIALDDLVECLWPELDMWYIRRGLLTGVLALVEERVQQ